jgi:membrane fusion protein (multidrug efflux system)
MIPVRISFLAAAIALTVSACGSGTEEPAADGGAVVASESVSSADPSGKSVRVIRVESMMLKAQGFDDIIEVTGSVEADNDATLSARSAGTLVQLKPLGTRVAAGYAVAQIDPSIAKAALDQTTAQRDVAAAQLELMEDLFRRQEPLYRDSIISPIEFQQVRAQLSQAKAQHAQAEALVKQAQEQVSLTIIAAPFSGVVEAHFVERGEQVAPGVPVVRVVSTQRVRVAAGIPERFAGEIETGSTVRLRFNSYNVPERTARVTFVGSAIDAASRTLPIEVEVDNTDGALKPEMIADVFVTRSSVAAAIVIPQSAVLRDEEGSSVYVVDRSGPRPTAQRRIVTLGDSYGGNVVVSTGLESGDELITVGANNVAPGDFVETIGDGSLTEAL